MARPRKLEQDKRTEKIEVYVTSSEKEIIENNAKNFALKSSEFLRLLGLDYEPDKMLNSEEIELYTMFSKYQNNFSKITTIVRVLFDEEFIDNEEKFSKKMELFDELVLLKNDMSLMMKKIR